METSLALLFAATVLPLICTPGPDMLFIAAQALSGGGQAGLRATAGVCLGYVVHSALVAAGVAAIVAASPLLFVGLRWFGVAYLAWLACQLMRSALRPSGLGLPQAETGGQLGRGFLTALLNPKGMMIYFAILPQFIDHAAPIGPQALVLSAIFVGLCGIVYALLSWVLGALGRRGGFDDRQRRLVEGTAGALLVLAAGRLAMGTL